MLMPKLEPETPKKTDQNCNEPNQNTQNYKEFLKTVPSISPSKDSQSSSPLRFIKNYVNYKQNIINKIKKENLRNRSNSDIISELEEKKICLNNEINKKHLKIEELDQQIEQKEVYFGKLHRQFQNVEAFYKIQKEMNDKLINLQKEIKTKQDILNKLNHCIKYHESLH